MVLRKRWLATLAIITTVLLLAACGGKKDSGQIVDPIYDNPRNHSMEDFMPISKGFVKYPVWIETVEDPIRDSKIKNIYVFKKDKVTMYNLDGASGIVIEDILDMSDDELIKFAYDTSNDIYDELEKEITNKKLFNIKNFNEKQKGFYSAYESYKETVEAYFKDQTLMNEDIYYSVEGERSKQSSSYTLDIKLDDLGQYTKKIDFEIPNATFNLINNTNSIIFEDYIEFLFFNIDTIFLADKNHFNERKENYIERLKQYGNFIKRDGFELTHPQNFVPNPYVWEVKDKTLSIDGESFNKTIFDTTFSGLKTGSGSLLTRVDDSFVGFRLDSPDSKSKNVTIEGQ